MINYVPEIQKYAILTVGEQDKIQKNNDSEVRNPCPICGEELLVEGRCNTCLNCFWSKCDI